ncbi:RNA-directed DNA polymerase, eukaryota, nucleotide-binding alpha-beta plait domain protein, partial [Tanacetum coccineum]
MGVNNQNSFKSKEDQTQKISKSVFVTNFPEHFSARDLWNACLAYGTVVDVYIPFKKSKAVGAAHKSFATVLSNGIVNPNSANATPALVLNDS